MTDQNTIEATGAKYIKLGEKGVWERHCFDRGIIRLGYYEVPHELALSGNKEAIRQIYIDEGFSPGVSSGHARQVLEFYNTGPETIWVTFSEGYMWWCQTSQDVDFVGSDETQNPTGSRFKQTLSGWSNTSVDGQPLIISNLSGHLTSVAAYRQTICDIKSSAFDYLLRKINGQLLPDVEKAKKARESLISTIEQVIRLLTWKDFEGFVEMVFSKSGWLRVSAVGGPQKTIDIEFVLPLTNERAIVQVKSQTDQNQFNQYAESMSSHGADRAYYVYHSSHQKIDAGNSHVSLMDVSKLADCAVRAGLVDWLIEKTG
jgi:Restriction endonuclease